VCIPDTSPLIEIPTRSRLLTDGSIVVVFHR
jgi:hypothetical protein